MKNETLLLVSWLLTVAVHGSVLLLAVWLIDSRVASLRTATRELLWRTALFGCVLTATLQFSAPYAPLAGRWQLAEKVPAVAGFAAIDAQSQVNIGTAKAPANRISFAARDTASSSDGSFFDRGAPPAIAAWISLRKLLGALVAAWIAGVIFALLRLGISFSRLRRALAGAFAIDDPALREELNVLAGKVAVATPELYCVDGILSPLAVFGARIVLPSWAVASLEPTQLRAMIAHELAHIARHDPAWKLIAALWRSLFWFIPFHSLAQRRLDEIAELTCDAFAADRSGGGRRVAECLAACAQRQVSGDAFEFAPAMASRQSSLIHRIERLLEGVSMENLKTRARARFAAAIGLALSVACLPMIGSVPRTAHAAPTSKTVEPSKASTHSSVSTHEDDDGNQTMNVSVSDDGRKFNAKVDGKLQINDDESDITSLSDGGTATFSETVGGVTRKLDLKQSGAALQRHFYIDSTEQPIDAAAHAWIGSVVKELERSGIGAESRVKRLFAKGGAAAVLDETDNVKSDYVRGVYLKALLAMGALTPAEVARALQIAGAMSSDYDRGQTLNLLFDRQKLDVAQQIIFLQQADGFDSDYDRAQLLVGAVTKLDNTPEINNAWMQVAEGLSSDYDRQRTYAAMLDSGRLDEAQLQKVIEATDAMGSDHDRRELLTAILHRSHKIDALTPAYLNSARALGSSYDHREALLALIHAGPLNSENAGALLDSAAEIDSSYDLREVLVSLARVMPQDPKLVQHYLSVSAQLSESDRNAAEDALPQAIQ